MSFFDNSLVVTQLDRRSYTTDFIKFTNGVQTFNPEHFSLIEPLMEKYGYTFNSGTATDVGGLRKRGLKVSSHNLSCGYFNEHSDTEIASVALLINAFSFAYDMLTMLAERNIPLTFPSYTPKYDSELPYGGSKVKTTSTPLGHGGRQINMWDVWEDDDEDYIYDYVLGEWVENPTKSKKKLKDPFEQTASIGKTTKEPTYWSRETPSELFTPEEEKSLTKAEEEYQAYSAWMEEVYPEYQVKENRKELKSFSAFFPDASSDTRLEQDLIDEMIIDDVCPNCYRENTLHITNDLLLHTCCPACESVFNVAKEDQEFIESKVKECMLGRIDFEEIMNI